jgi:hypothetical protein
VPAASPSSTGWSARDFERALSRRAYRVDRPHFAGDPAEALDGLEFAAALRHQLHANADAEKRPAAANRGLHDRRFQARHGGKAATAIGEGADPGQHDALRAGDLFRPARHQNRPGDATLRGRTLECLGGRAQIAGPVIDDRGGHARLLEPVMAGRDPAIWEVRGSIPRMTGKGSRTEISLLKPNCRRGCP